MRLNLGAGDSPLEGYINVDRKSGREVYPLGCPSGCADDIRASHVLEHFSHRETVAVLADWVDKLKPGGTLRVAVPDFEIIARRYLAGDALPVEGYVMGGHVDSDDRHGAIFDQSSLTDALRAAGLVAIQRWHSEIKDCAALPISLNLMGYKPPTAWPKVSAVMSVPRLGFMDNFFCAYQLPSLGIQLRKQTGAFWGQCLTRAIEEALKEDPEYILTVDYDTVFTKDDVRTLMMLMMINPGIDALAPIQASRTKSTPLMTVKKDGQNVSELPWDAFQAPTMPISTAHFGLTLIRADKIAALPRPWFAAIPDMAGRWDEGRTDDDIHFWRQWEAQGYTLHLANRVAVGHGEFMVRWPDQSLSATYQHPSEFWSTGKPEEVWK